MSSGSKSSAGSEVVLPIPAGSRKVVQRLKEIVNCSEAEIYAALRDCDMDPNEAVNRLIIQDPFHEVRSKREKKKEGKDIESRLHGSYDNFNQGGKNAGDRYLGHTSSTPYSSFESAPANGKIASLKENGSTRQTSAFCSVQVFSGNNKSKCPQSFRDGVVGENKKSSLDTSDGNTSGRRPPYGYQSAWNHSPDQVSMADIGKMGTPLDKASSDASSSDLTTNHLDIQGPKTSTLQNNVITSDNHPSNIDEAGAFLAHSNPSYNEGPSADKLVDTNTLFPVYSMDSEMHLGTADLVCGSINQQSESEEMRGTEDNIQKPGMNDMVSALESFHNIAETNSKSASLSENDLRNDIMSYQPHDSKHHKDEVDDASVSSISRNFLQINVNKDAKGLPSEADEFTLIIPDHLLVQTADCLHLRFGSFRPGMSAACASGTEKNNLVGKRNEVDVSSVGYFNTRIADYFDGDTDRTASGVDALHGIGSNIGSYDVLSAAQEKIKPENVEMAHGNPHLENAVVAHGKHHLQNVEMAHGNHHSFPASNRNYTFDDVPRLNESLNQSEMSSQLQNLTPFTNVMSHANSLASTLLASGVPPGNESDHQYPPFRVPQSAKSGSSDHSEISMSEALKIAGFSSMQSSTPLPQHVAVHPYSQPTMPPGPYATNMIGYPFVPQNYTFMPSAYQQTVTGNSAYQQSLAEILSQYKNSLSVNNLGHSSPASIGNIPTNPGNLLMNPPTPMPGATFNYGDSSIPQYKERNHLISLLQNSNSGLLLNSRMPAAVQSSTLDNYHRQNQQYGGFNQGQQSSPDYGYPNIYNSHVGGTARDQQPHNSRIEFPDRSQGQPKKLSQLWQNGY